MREDDKNVQRHLDPFPRVSIQGGCLARGNVFLSEGGHSSQHAHVQVFLVCLCVCVQPFEGLLVPSGVAGWLYFDKRLRIHVLRETVTTFYLDLSVCLSACLPACHCVCLAICPCLLVLVPVCLPVCLFACLLVNLSSFITVFLQYAILKKRTSQG